MSTNGRPPALSEAKKSKIVALLSAGCSKLTAAGAVNCHPQTIVNTARRDPLFAEKMAAAENAAELLHLKNINKAAMDAKYWRASAWMLERLRPETFGRPAPDAIGPAQLSALVLQIAEIVVQEIPVAAFRTQILKRFDRLLRETTLLRAPAEHLPLGEASTAGTGLKDLGIVAV
jgi:hypothetical protein